MKGMRTLVRTFESKPFKETNLGVAQAILDTENIPSFMPDQSRLPTHYECFSCETMTAINIGILS